jgi:hypothetical protein
MNNTFNAQEVIVGTHARVWINDTEYVETKGLTIELTPQYSDVDIINDFAKHEKLTGYEGSGEITLNKRSSKLMKMVVDNLKNGKATVVKIVSSLNDPSALGEERVVIYDAVLKQATLAGWTTKEVLEEKVPFTFTKYDILSHIDY